MLYLRSFNRFILISLALLGVSVSSANAALIGVLPATPNSTNWQAYYDDQLDISWTANAKINGSKTWDNQVAWAAGLDIDGVTGWRLPSMDVNGDDVIVNCSVDQAACMDNEYGHLFNYGDGTVFGSGITASSPGPFSNVQLFYWSGTDAPNPSRWSFLFDSGFQSTRHKDLSAFAWAVHSGNVGSGNVGAVPVPAAVWLFGTALIGFIGMSRRTKVA
jgi:hypothetical protein